MAEPDPIELLQPLVVIEEQEGRVRELLHDETHPIFVLLLPHESSRSRRQDPLALTVQRFPVELRIDLVPESDEEPAAG